MKFKYITGTSFTKWTLFLNKVSFIINTHLPLLMMCYNQFIAMCADIQEVKTTKSKVPAHHADESCRLLQENARMHTNLRTREEIAKMELTALPHPPYGPDLVPPNFHFLGHLKDALRGRRFADEDKLKHSVHTSVESYTRSADSVLRKSGKVCW